jgi:gliding motility-associated-like protein
MVFELLADTIFVSDTICEGDVYLFGSDTLKVSGNYTMVIRCDSVYVVDLEIKNRSFSILEDSMCVGGTYLFNNKILTVSGIYNDTLMAENGCDSIITLTLNHQQPIKTIKNETICRGNTYFFDGINLTESGVYVQTLKTAGGCDSIVELNLSTVEKIEVQLMDQFCDQSSYLYEDEIITLPGVYVYTFQSSGGCDSVITLVLTNIFSDTTYVNAIIEEGQSYLFGNDYLTSAGIYKDTLQNSSGCDSIVILNLGLNVHHSVSIPDGFSPNNDGVNDVFVIQHLEFFPQNKILIFNRWGNKVFEAAPYENNWDGKNHFGITVGGDLLPVGTYFYILTLGDGSAEMKGFIFLNR